MRLVPILPICLSPAPESREEIQIPPQREDKTPEEYGIPVSRSVVNKPSTTDFDSAIQSLLDGTNGKATGEDMLQRDAVDVGVRAQRRFQGQNHLNQDN